MTKTLEEILPKRNNLVTWYKPDTIQEAIEIGNALGYNSALDACLKSLQDAGVVVCPSEKEIENCIVEWLGYDTDFSRQNASEMSKALRSYLLGKG